MNETLFIALGAFCLLRPESIFLFPGILISGLLIFSGIDIPGAHLAVIIIAFSSLPLASWLLGVKLDAYAALDEKGLWSRYLPLISLGFFGNKICSAEYIDRTLSPLVSGSLSELSLLLLQTVTESITWATLVAFGLTLTVSVFETSLIAFRPRVRGASHPTPSSIRFCFLLLVFSFSLLTILEGAARVF